MKLLFRILLALLLPLHAGLAQATMEVHAPATLTVEVALQVDSAAGQATPDALPCHGEAQLPAAPDQSPLHDPLHDEGCCDAGSCHCVATGVLPVIITRITPQPGFIVPPFSFLSVPAAARPPDLRPPIR